MSVMISYSVTFFIAFILPIVIYSFVLKNNPSIREFIVIPITEAVIMLIFGIFISIMSSMQKCNSYRGIIAFLNALKLVFSVLITYAIIFLFPQFQFPFMKITGPFANMPFMPYLAQGILLGLATIPAVTAIWMSSQKYGCYMTQTQIKESKEQINTELQKNPENPT